MKGASSLDGEGLGSSLQCIVFFSKLFDSIAIKRDASDKVSFCSEGVQSRQMRSMSRVHIYIEDTRLVKISFQFSEFGYLFFSSCAYVRRGI